MVIEWQKNKSGKVVVFYSSGDIYNALDEQTGKYLAAKVEVADSKYPQLHLEYKVYKQMAKYNGFPRVYWQGEHDLISNGQVIRSNVMIMDILGDSLEKLNQNRSLILSFNKREPCLKQYILKQYILKSSFLC